MLKQVLMAVLLVGCSEAATTARNSDGAAGGGGAASDDDAAGGAGGVEAGMAGAAGEPDLGPAPPGDTCADAVDINEEASRREDGALIITGTNMGARSDLEASCDTFSAPLADVVYAYTPEATGGLRWTFDGVTSTQFVADVRSECDSTAASLQCDSCALHCSGDIEVTAGETLYFAIFGVRTSNSPDGTGVFDLILQLTPDPGVGDACVSPYHGGGRACPADTVCQDEQGEAAICGESACGDGLLSFEPLECDDGNSASDDGCSAVCEPDLQGPGAASCEAPTTLNLPRMRQKFETAHHRHPPRMRAILDDSVFSLASGAGDFVDGSDLSASCSDAAGPEAVYWFELLVPSYVKISAQNAEVLSLRRAGDTDCGTEELGCIAGSASSALELPFELEAGRYAVIADREEPTLAATPSYVVDVFVNTR